MNELSFTFTAKGRKCPQFFNETGYRNQYMKKKSLILGYGSSMPTQFINRQSALRTTQIKSDH